MKLKLKLKHCCRMDLDLILGSDFGSNRVCVDQSEIRNSGITAAFIFHDIILLEGVLRDERTRWGIKILLEVPRSTKKLNKVFYQN